jgi:hypothetical protein
MSSGDRFDARQHVSGHNVADKIARLAKRDPFGPSCSRAVTIRGVTDSEKGNFLFIGFVRKCVCPLMPARRDKRHRVVIIRRAT